MIHKKTPFMEGEKRKVPNTVKSCEVMATMQINAPIRSRGNVTSNNLITKKMSCESEKRVAVLLNCKNIRHHYNHCGQR